jgi:pyridoxal phosphate enzyme (YggS family)
VTIGDRLAQVRTRIERAALAAGRSAAEVELVAVSKTRSPDELREAFRAGQRAFGENYAQELAAKADALKDIVEIEWHFVGHLQTNKAKIAAKYADIVHTLDSAAVARALGRRVMHEGRGREMPVLIEVNVGGEPQKAGATPGELAEVMDAVRSQEGLSLRGLMTMPPSGDVDEARRAFETLSLLRNLHGGRTILPELSMGMSQDLEVAIACGATIVRVGTAIFGPRE